MATTTNYGWTTPDDTALVKDGAAAIRSLGTSVDTTTKNLNPETTLGDISYRSSTANVNTRLPLGTAGQVLKVNSGATAPEWSSDNAGMTNPMTTTGDTIYSSSGSTPARLGIGTAGQVLRVNSGATAPEWATVASASGLTLVKTQTIGSAVTSVTVTDAFSSTYDNYLITINGGVASNSTSYLSFTLGSTTAGYSYSGIVMQYTSNTVTGASQNNGSAMFGGYFSTNALSTEMVLQSPFLSKRTIFSTKTAAAEAANYIGNHLGFLDNNTSYTAFTFTVNSGNITGGTIRVYGYQNS